MALADTVPISSGHQVHRTVMRRSVVLTSGASRRQAAALEGKRQRMLKCAASEQYGHVRMICGGKGAPRSTCGAIVAEAPDGRFLDKVPDLVEFHLLHNGPEGEDCRFGASSKCREARGIVRGCLFLGCSSASSSSMSTSSSIAKLYHAKFDDVATGLHHREIISRSAITSVFAQLSSKMSPYGCACEAGEVRWCSAGLDPSGNAGEKLSLIANTLNQGRGAF